MNDMGVLSWRSFHLRTSTSLQYILFVLFAPYDYVSKEGFMEKKWKKQLVCRILGVKKSHVRLNLFFPVSTAGTITPSRCTHMNGWGHATLHAHGASCSARRLSLLPSGCPYQVRVCLVLAMFSVLFNLFRTLRKLFSFVVFTSGLTCVWHMFQNVTWWRTTSCYISIETGMEFMPWIWKQTIIVTTESVWSLCHATKWLSVHLPRCWGHEHLEVVFTAPTQFTYFVVCLLWRKQDESQNNFSAVQQIYYTQREVLWQQ